jgi:alanine racemase
MSYSTKNTNKISQQKIRKIIKSEGKVAVSDYVTRETKETLVSIKSDFGYNRLGDSIDFLAKYYLDTSNGD